jgi:hypothetical protein
VPNFSLIRPNKRCAKQSLALVSMTAM